VQLEVLRAAAGWAREIGSDVAVLIPTF
jgi:hypothetical protein